MTLTEAQQKVLDFVRAAIRDNGYPPTRWEIANALGYASANAAHEHLEALQRKGVLKVAPRVSRGIRLTQANES